MENEKLTNKEREILDLLITSGTSSKVIAHVARIAYGTVKVYESHIYRKLGIQNGRIELLTREVSRLKTELAAK